MKRAVILLLLLTLSLVLAFPASAFAEEPDTSARAMILWQPDTDMVLAEKNADDPMLIASTTKLLTALTAVRYGDLAAETTVLPEWTEVEGSRMYLCEGDVYTLRELLEGLLLCSGNDAALGVAGAVSGGTEAFVQRMNELASELGMENSHFANPHGLNAEGHASTARDMARLMKAVTECEVLREILARPSACIHGRTVENHNRLLRSCPGVFAGKTGYTAAAGRCLVSCCERDGWPLICVTLNDPRDWEDHAALYDWGYACYTCENAASLCPELALPVISGIKASVPLLCGDVRLCHLRGERIECTLCVPPFLFAPVYAGTETGTVLLKIGDGKETELSLYTGESVPGIPERSRRWVGEKWI